MMLRLQSWFRLFFRGFSLALAGRMAYRFDFVTSFFLMMISELVFPIITICIYRTGSSIPGWSLNEVLLVQSIYMLVKGVTLIFFSGMAVQTMNMVGEGTFDLLLLRPRSPLFMTVVQSFDMEDMGILFGGIIFSTYALTHLPPVSVHGILLCLASAIGGVMVLASIALFVAATSFVWIRNYRLFEIAQTLETFALYPTGIFSKSIRTVIAGAFPVALIGAIPAQMLLGRNTPECMSALAIAPVLLISATLLYYRMVRRYSSAGG